MSKKLLLADDSVVIQKLVGLSFANEDIEIFSTDNGDDALTRAREIRPDVILADVVMPGLSGYDVCQAIKQDLELAQTPVLLLTGTFEAFDEGRASLAGANGHITKPFEAQALVDRVREVINAAPPAAASKPAASASSTPRTPQTPQTPQTSQTPQTLGTSADASLDMDFADDLFGADLESLDSLDGADGGTASLTNEDLGLDLAEEISGAPAFPAAPEPDESTASGLFGAPGEGAAHDFDTHDGGLSLGESVSRGDSPTGTLDHLSEDDLADEVAEDATVAIGLGASLSPLARPDTRNAPAPLRSATEYEPTTPLPVARPVDLDAVLAGAAQESDAAERSIRMGEDDGNASTSPSLNGARGSARTGSLDDLTVHSPSADIDQARAAAPSPAAPTGSATSVDSGSVADLDAHLDDVHLASSARSAESPSASPARFRSEPVDTAADTIVAPIDLSDPLDFGPTNVPTDDLDFAFDVSEQVAADNLADRLERDGPDRYGDSFSSLMDISESQILGAHAANAGDSDTADSDRADSDRDREATEATEATDARRPAIGRPARGEDSIVAGYDVSTSDLATADDSFDRAGPTPPPIPEPERLEVLPELPQAWSPRTRPEPATRDDDLFEGLATGSPLEEMDVPRSFHSGSDLDVHDDLLSAHDSVEIGEAVPTRSLADRVPLEMHEPSEFDAHTDADADADASTAFEASEPESAGQADERHASLLSGIPADAAPAITPAIAAPDRAEDRTEDKTEDITEDVPADDLEGDFLETGDQAEAGPAFDDDAGLGDGFGLGDIVRSEAAAEDRRIPDLSPMMEQRIQETLEKVAWEAFSDLSESIVKQVMTRVEKIAWEVVPEMAETLVREEIRKMKGEQD